MAWPMAVSQFVVWGETNAYFFMYTRYAWRVLILFDLQDDLLCAWIRADS
jgi:hypothetical protein